MVQVMMMMTMIGSICVHPALHLFSLLLPACERDSPRIHHICHLFCCCHICHILPIHILMFVYHATLLCRTHCCSIFLCHLGCEIYDQHKYPTSNNRDQLVGPCAWSASASRQQMTAQQHGKYTKYETHYDLIPRKWDDLRVASCKHTSCAPPSCPVHPNSQIRLKSLNTICSSVKHFPRLKQNWWLALVLGEADVRSASACAVKAKRSRKRSVVEKDG